MPEEDESTKATDESGKAPVTADAASGGDGSTGDAAEPSSTSPKKRTRFQRIPPDMKARFWRVFREEEDGTLVNPTNSDNLFPTKAKAEEAHKTNQAAGYPAPDEEKEEKFSYVVRKVNVLGEEAN